MDELYNFRDCYFETHNVEEAEKKESDVAQEVEKTLKKLEEKEGWCRIASNTILFFSENENVKVLIGLCWPSPTDQFKNTAEYLLQKGRCLNVAPDFSTKAEECLSRAVKLQPGLVEGWNTLGEQYWKKGDLVAAKNCFTGALQQVKQGQGVKRMRRK